MKHSKKIFLLAALLSLSSCNATQLNSITPPLKGDTISTVLEESFAGANFKNEDIYYELNNSIRGSINTFEASIRLSTSSKNNIIFGSYNYYNNLASYVNNFINYEINNKGKVVVKWAGTTTDTPTITITFNNQDVRTNKWTHIAVTRNNSTSFSLYIDGEFVETVTCAATKDITNNEFKNRIGGDHESGIKSFFYGEIGSITCFSSARTLEQIKQDYNDVKTINSLNRGSDLLFHTLVELGKDVLVDTSSNLNNANIISCSYFYDAPKFEIKENSYSFGVIGDTQELSRFHPEGIEAYSNWLIENKEAYNIQAVMQMGDLSDQTGSSTNEENTRMWSNVSKAFRLMDNKVPYTFIPGNHDYYGDCKSRDLTSFNMYFPYNHYSKFSYFGGAYKQGQMQNAYYLFEINSIKYIILALEFGPDSNVMSWASDILSTYSDHRAIITTHGFIDAAGEVINSEDYLSPQWYFAKRNLSYTNPDVMWESYLSKHENVYMILCGHTSTETVSYRTLVGENGNTAMVFRIDPSYVLSGNSGNAFSPLLALFNINEQENKLTINYFSCESELLFNTHNQITINLETYEHTTHSFYNFGKDIA